MQVNSLGAVDRHRDLPKDERDRVKCGDGDRGSEVVELAFRRALDFQSHVNNAKHVT